MKKLIYIFILATVASFSIVSCTEQEVKPKGQPTVSDPVH